MLRLLIRQFLLDLFNPSPQQPIVRSRASGLQSIEKARQMAPEQAIVVLTNETSHIRALAAVKAGAQDFLTKGTYTPSWLASVVTNLS